MTGIQWRVRCLACEWRGVRTDHPDDCCCYDEWGAACRAAAPGPGCPRGVVWPCPRCGLSNSRSADRFGSTVRAVAPVRHRAAKELAA